MSRAEYALPKLPGVNHRDAIRALEKAGFLVTRQGKHVTLRGRGQRVIVPRNNPINAITMAAIVRDAGLALDEFKRLL